MPRKSLVCVLGMHRSGTSALTRVLNLCGLPLPRQEDLWPADEGNPEGYWESMPIVELHTKIMQSVGLSWDNPAPFPGNWFDSDWSRPFRKDLWQLIESDLEEKGTLLIKDPLMCRLVPLWIQLAAVHGVDIRFVLIVRNPLDVASSLARRDLMLSDQAFQMWSIYVGDAERHTRNWKRHWVLYEDLMTWGTYSLTREFLPPVSASAAKSASSFLKSALWHHHSHPADLLDVPESIRRQYEDILNLSWAPYSGEGIRR